MSDEGCRNEDEIGRIIGWDVSGVILKKYRKGCCQDEVFRELSGIIGN